jgi:outer membrane protein TolC
MKRITLIIILAVFTFTIGLHAQNPVDSVLEAIERNNTTLAAIRKTTDAEKIGNKTGIYLSNPEVEFNYLWGNPSGIGNRTDFSVKQTFDFPTAYSYKSQISNLKNEQAELEYAKQRKEVLLQARLLCADLINANAQRAEYSKRKEHAEKLAALYKAKFEAGEVSVLEINKTRVNLLNISKELESIEIRRNTLLLELATLNGGIAIDFNELNFLVEPIDPDFEKWYGAAQQRNPILQWLKQEIEIGQKQEKLTKALSLPKVTGGYMSEKVVGQQYQGITAGISIPLWENKNAVKNARAKSEAMQSVEADAKLQFYNEMKMLHAKATGLAESVAGYRQNLAQFSNGELLQKALDKGEISLGEYLFELSVYYESTDRMLEMEKEMNCTVAELSKFE